MTSSLILLAAFALTFAVTRRLAISLMLISPLYLAFVLAERPQSQLHGRRPFSRWMCCAIPEFLPFFGSFFGTEGIVAVISAVGIWLWGLYHHSEGRRQQPVSRTSRWVIGVMAFAVLLALLIGILTLGLFRHWHSLFSLCSVHPARILGTREERRPARFPE